MSIIDEYLATVDEPTRAEFEHIRKLVHDLAPSVEETKSYGMPAFKYKGKYLAAFAAFKDHLSLFPTSGPVVLLKDKLGDFASSKGTIQFTVERPLPESLIKEVILARMAAIDK